MQERARVNAERVQLALAAGAIIGTWFWDIPNDRFTVEPAFAGSFDLDPKLGHKIVATVHPDDRDALVVAIARRGAYAHQYRVMRESGQYYWAEADGRVDHIDGVPIGFPGISIDVDERRAVEAERRPLARSEQGGSRSRHGDPHQAVSRRYDRRPRPRDDRAAMSRAFGA